MQMYQQHAKVTSSNAFAVLVIALLLAAAPQAQAAPAVKSIETAVDKLVAAAQSVLQQAKQDGVADDVEPEEDVDRQRGVSFTTPVDGYFIQVRQSLQTRNSEAAHCNQVG